MKKKQRVLSAKKENLKLEPKTIPRRRTVFPLRVNFHGWWIRSKKGIIAQMVRDGRDCHDSFVYRLIYAEAPGYPQILGGGLFTTENMLDGGMMIYETKKEAEHGSRKATTT